MKNLLIAALTCLGSFLLTAENIHYVQEKKDGVIRFAANDMARCLSAVTGKKYEAKTKASAIKAGDIVIKNNPALGEQAWSLTTKDGVLYVEGNNTPGIVYGIYNFLEKYAGCAWLDPDTEILPVQKNWKLPEIKESGAPAMWRREVYVGDPLDATWRLRNRENARARVNFSYGRPRDNHTFDYYVTKIKDPKLFKVSKAGKPCSTLCMTDPEVRKIILTELMKNIEKDRSRKSADYHYPRIYDISQQDGASGGECWCGPCRKLAEEQGSYSGPNIDFVNYLAREVAKKYPDIILSTFAYSFTTVPPKTLKAEKNIAVRYCSAWIFNPLAEGTPQAKMLEDWRKKASILSVWSYWRTYKGSMYPQVKSRKDLQNEFRFCKKMNVKIYFAEAEAPLSRSFSMLQHWLGLKLMEDPDRGAFKLADQFMKGYYGKAAPAMLKYLEYLEHTQKEDRTFLNRTFFETVNKYLDEAEKLAKGDAKSLLHIGQERVIVDRSMYDNLAKLLKEGYAPDLKKIAQRFLVNGRNTLNNWSSYRKPGVKEQKLKRLEQEAALYKYFPVEIPKIFDGCEVIDMQWTQIRVSGLGNQYKPVFVNDPDAVCGTAFYNPALKAKAPYNIGFYNPKTKQGGGITLQRQEIPTDEKFHLYKLGSATIMAPLYINFDETWRFRAWLATVGIVPEERDIWVSIKFTGPNFVSGSKKPNRVLFDRVFLVKDPDPLRHYKPVDPKKNLIKNSSFEQPVYSNWIPGWGRTNDRCMVDNTVSHSGKSSLKVGNSAKKSIFIAAHLADLDKWNNDLLIRGWYKYEGILMNNLPFVGLWTLTKEGKNGYSKPLFNFYPGNYSWQRFETVISAQDFKKAVARSRNGKLAKKLTFRINMSKQPGWVWLDDIEVIPLEKK